MPTPQDTSGIRALAGTIGPQGGVGQRDETGPHQVGWLGQAQPAACSHGWRPAGVRLRPSREPPKRARRSVPRIGRNAAAVPRERVSTSSTSRKPGSMRTPSVELFQTREVRRAPDGLDVAQPAGSPPAGRFGRPLVELVETAFLRNRAWRPGRILLGASRWLSLSKRACRATGAEAVARQTRSNNLVTFLVDGGPSRTRSMLTSGPRAGEVIRELVGSC